MNRVGEIIRLHETAGFSIRQISKALNVSRPVVDQYLRLARLAELQWAEIEPMDDEQLLQRFDELTARAEDPRYTALRGRLPHYVRIFSMDGDSYRVQQKPQPSPKEELETASA